VPAGSSAFFTDGAKIRAASDNGVILCFSDLGMLKRVTGFLPEVDLGTCEE
jgi:hypothetical protein